MPAFKDLAIERDDLAQVQPPRELAFGQLPQLGDPRLNFADLLLPSMLIGRYSQ